MKPLSAALKKGIVAMKAGGASYRAVSRSWQVPLGTVKSLCAKAKLKTAMEPPSKKGKAVAMEPQAEGPSSVHRGLRSEDMPGRTQWERRMTFAVFRRGEWPPRHWKIPATLEGIDLREMLVERAAMYRGKGAGK